MRRRGARLRPGSSLVGSYHGGMTLSAQHVAAELRRRLPGLPGLKLQKLLYYCQGHHLAAVGEPLFKERVVAFDMGPVVADLWRAERDNAFLVHPDELIDPAARMTNVQLNTIGLVVSRYGSLSGRDLINLSHGEEPWKQADARRSANGEVEISTESMRDYFASEPDDEQWPTEADLARAAEGLMPRGAESGRTDDLSALRDRLARLSDQS